MVQVDVSVAFAIGTMFADAKHRQLKNGRPEYYCINLKKISNIIFQFDSGLFHPQLIWLGSNSYVVPRKFGYGLSVFRAHLPGNLLAAVNTGFLLGHRLVTAGNHMANQIVDIAIFFYSAAWIFSQADSPFRLGAYAQPEMEPDDPQTPANNR